jgi:hypothetical protein
MSPVAGFLIFQGKKGLQAAATPFLFAARGLPKHAVGPPVHRTSVRCARPQEGNPATPNPYVYH